jgi:aspartyl-tRNA(Asn)/glutamyl-tRNA(Gln) amidotransferase subunit B
MERGEMRLEPNVSLKQITNKLPNYKVEIKNINSFRFVRKAINYEIERQKKILDSGETPIQETRGWDSEKQITISQRVKEEAMDYRYFPEPDVPPIRWSQPQIFPRSGISLRETNLKSQIPELPDVKFLRFQKEYGLSEYDSEILAKEKVTADYFEEAVRASRKVSSIKYEVLSKNIANYIINKKIDINKILPTELAQIITKDSQKETIDEKKLSETINQILSQNPKAVADYKRGKIQVIGFLLGKVRQVFYKGSVNQIKKVLEEYLKK